MGHYSKAFFILFICIYPLSINAQFLAEDPTWQYDYFSYPTQGTHTFNKYSDTIIQGKECITLMESGENYHVILGNTNSFTRMSDIILCEEDSVVFVHLKDNLFDTLYNFKTNNQQGWSLEFPNKWPSDSVNIKVLENGISKINGQDINHIVVEYSTDSIFSIYLDTIYQYIGNISGFIIPWYYYYHYLDGPFYSFQCYYDSKIGLFKRSENCEINIVQNQKIELSNLLQVYPNPTNGRISIISLVQEPVEIKIFNSIGIKIYSGRVKGTNSIDFSYFPPGIYFLNTTHSAGVFLVERIVKH